MPRSRRSTACWRTSARPQLPQVLVLNKADLTGWPAGFERDEYGKIARLRVSAKTGAGLDLVRLAIDEFRSGATLTGIVRPAQLR